MSTSKAPLTLHFTWDRTHFLKASVALFKHEQFHTNRRFIGWLIIAMTQFGIVAALKHNSYALLLFSTLLLAYWYYGKLALKKLLIKWRFKEDMKQEFTITFDTDTITINGQTLPLSSITAVKELEEGFIFSLKRQNFYLPKEAFKSAQSIEHFKSNYKEWF